jgi:phenylalanyl-tRNA synthetase beta chain
MRIPLSWLKRYLDLEISPEVIAETLTLAGLEVDAVENQAPEFEGVIVATVLETQPHPNADRLKVATVFDGKENLQIVCGAPNCRPGLRVALAQIGATLKDDDGKSWKIKKSKLRDVESHGMLCSERELKLSTSHEQIIEFPEDVVVGTPVSELYGDTIFEISLTPNLGHCMSVYGIARELAALLNLKIVRPEFHLQESKTVKTSDVVSVALEAPEKSSHYTCRLVKGIRVGPSPQWLKKWIEAAGMRSINNVVDIGNFVMLEYGQPLHMFDADKIVGGTIRATTKAPEASLVALDDKEYQIPVDTLLICDQKKILAIAGIIGGKGCSVADTTVNVMIESALFTPETVRKTSKQLKLRTESSSRFEKGIDPAGVVRALDRAAILLAQVAGGEIAHGYVSSLASLPERKTILCRVPRVNALLGTQLSANEIASLFHRLEMDTIFAADEQLLVTVPTYRNDLSIEVDLIEEVARVYGYNKLPKSVPLHPSSNLADAPIYQFENLIRTALVQLGLQEWRTCDLISPELAALSLERGMSKESLIHVLEPRNIDQSVLRASLIPGMLACAKHNQDHQNWDLHAFEVGKIHFRDQSKIVEPSVATLLLSGANAPYNWESKQRAVDFFDLKGVIENLLPTATFQTSHFHHFHPGRQATIVIDALTIGVIGEIHPTHLRKIGIDGRVLCAEINLTDLMPHKKHLSKVKEIPLYPSSSRDWTLSIHHQVPVGDLLAQIKSYASPLLETVSVHDLYAGEKAGKELKNVTFRFIYRDLNKTISQEVVDAEHAKITQQVAEKLAHGLH